MNTPLDTTHPPRTRNLALTIVLSAAGGIAAVGALLAGVFGGWPGAGRESASYAVQADGVRAIDIESSFGSVDVRFANVQQATLVVNAQGIPVDAWSIAVDDGVLEVEGPSGSAPRWWVAPWSRESNAVLTVPRTLERPDLSLELAAGSATIDGRFGELDLSVVAGEAKLTGEADTVRLELAAGAADVQLQHTTNATLSVGAGDITAAFGEGLEALTLEVAAGQATVDVPPGPYAVTSDASAGDVDVRVPEDATADRTIDVRTESGSVVIRESR